MFACISGSFHATADAEYPAAQLRLTLIDLLLSIMRLHNSNRPF